MRAPAIALALSMLAFVGCSNDDVARPALRTWRLVGDLRFPAGRPAPNVYVYLGQRIFPSAVQGALHFQRELTDAGGAFEFAGVPAGDFALFASADADTMAAGASFRLGVPAADGDTTRKPLALVRAGRFVGTARLVGAADHSNVYVEVDGAPVLGAETNTAGGWAIDRIPPGRWTLIATPLVHPPGFGYTSDTASAILDPAGASVTVPALELRPVSPSPLRSPGASRVRDSH